MTPITVTAGAVRRTDRAGDARGPDEVTILTCSTPCPLRVHRAGPVYDATLADVRAGFAQIVGIFVLAVSTWLLGSERRQELLALWREGVSALEAQSGSTPATPVVPSPQALAATAATAPEALRVLFVGNSHTFMNDMPAMIAALAHVGGKRPLHARLIARGGARLEEHAKDGVAIHALSERGWHALILQEQQQWPTFQRAQREREMNQPARLISMNAQAIGARTIVQMVWARRDGDTDNVPGDTFAAMHARTVLGHRELAHDIGAELAPTAIAWKRAAELRPDLALWQPDGSHAAVAGTYLGACVLYQTLYSASPKGLRFTAGLPERDAAFLQHIAATTLLE